MKNNNGALSKDIFNKKIQSDSLTLLCSQFAIILKSGAQVSLATKLIYKQCEDKVLKSILEKVSKDVSSGINLSDSFEKNGEKKFPPTFYETIRAGEHSGNLVNAFKTLEEYFKKQSKIIKQIKSALIYPVFVISIAIVVLIVVMAYVVPKLVEIFNNMGGNIPLITKVLISVSSFFSSNIMFIIIALIAMVIFLIVYISSENGRLVFDRIKLKLPIIGKVLVCSISAQFASTLSMLLESGLVMSKALLVLSKVFSNCVYNNAVKNLSKNVQFGKKLSISMRKENCFPNTLVEMTSIGEETGELEEILKTIGDYYQNESDNAIKSLLAKLEPALLVFVAIFAGFIVFAIYIPLFQMYDLF